MLANACLLQLVEVDRDVVTELALKVELLNSDTRILLLQVEDLCGTLGDHYLCARDVHFLQADILNRTILLADLLESILGNLYLIGDQYLISVMFNS